MNCDAPSGLGFDDIFSNPIVATLPPHDASPTSALLPHPTATLVRAHSQVEATLNILCLIAPGYRRLLMKLEARVYACPSWGSACLTDRTTGRSGIVIGVPNGLVFCGAPDDYERCVVRTTPSDRRVLRGVRTPQAITFDDYISCCVIHEVAHAVCPEDGHGLGFTLRELAMRRVFTSRENMVKRAAHAVAGPPSVH